MLCDELRHCARHYRMLQESTQEKLEYTEALMRREDPAAIEQSKMARMQGGGHLTVVVKTLKNELSLARKKAMHDFSGIQQSAFPPPPPSNLAPHTQATA